MSMYQRVWVRRSHHDVGISAAPVWCSTATIPRDCYAAGSSSTADRACARPTVSLGVSFEALASNLPDGGPSLFAVQPPSRVTVSPSRHQTEVSTRSELPLRDHRRPKPAPFRPRRLFQRLARPCGRTVRSLAPSTVCSTSILGQLSRADRRVRDSPFRGWYPTHSTASSSPAAAFLSLTPAVCRCRHQRRPRTSRLQGLAP
jgi:hypothetical protein